MIGTRQKHRCLLPNFRAQIINRIGCWASTITSNGSFHCACRQPTFAPKSYICIGCWASTITSYRELIALAGNHWLATNCAKIIQRVVICPLWTNLATLQNWVLAGQRLGFNQMLVYIAVKCSFRILSFTAYCASNNGGCLLLLYVLFAFCWCRIMFVCDLLLGGSSFSLLNNFRNLNVTLATTSEFSLVCVCKYISFKFVLIFLYTFKSLNQTS
jgi:hypothetical protein